MSFSEVFNKIESNLRNHNNGDYNCIPFMGMERLEEFLPGVEKSTYYLLTANSGVFRNAPVKPI